MTSSDIDAARLTYTVQYPSVADLTVGETDVTLIEVSVSNDDSEDVHVAELGFSLFSIPWDHVASPTLHVAGDALTISAAEHPTEEVLRLTLSDEHLIERGGTVVFELRGDIVDGACDVLNMDFDPQHSTATGSTYRFHAVWQIGAGSQLPFDRNIAGECS